MSKVIINAVHERDAKKYWEHLGMKEKEKCFICGTEVTWRNFSALGAIKGDIKVACEKGSCFSRFIVRQRNIKLGIEK
jgi:hypothetical protein